MKLKLKECDACHKITVIWKNHEGFKYCKYCWSCQKTINSNSLQKPNDYKIPLVSSKRKKQDQEYSKLRKTFLTERTLCEVKVAGCMMHATDVHHTFAGANRNVYYLIQSTWIPVCRACHNWIHEHPKESRELGYLK